MNHSGLVKLQPVYIRSVTSCSATFTPEYYDTVSASWMGLTSAQPYINAISLDPNDSFIEFDLVDPASVPYRPETSINFRWTATIDDSIAAGSTFSDSFTITFTDLCKAS